MCRVCLIVGNLFKEILFCSFPTKKIIRFDPFGNKLLAKKKKGAGQDRSGRCLNPDVPAAVRVPRQMIQAIFEDLVDFV